MTMEKVIVMTACRRPRYTWEVLAALSRCEGISDYIFMPFVEPGNDEVWELCSSFGASRLTVASRNDYQHGCNANTAQAFTRGFARSDFVIFIEDDVIVGRDYLHFMEWAAKRYIEDKNVMAVSGYNRDDGRDEPYRVVRRVNQFRSWGMGTWIDRWPLFACAMQKLRGHIKVWDESVSLYYPDILTVNPLLSRCQNIGADDSTFVVWQQYVAQHYTPYWASSLPPGNYRES